MLNLGVGRDESLVVDAKGKTTEAESPDEWTAPSTRRTLLAAGTVFALAAACKAHDDTAVVGLGEAPEILPFSEGSEVELPELQPRSDDAWSGEKDDSLHTLPPGWDPFKSQREANALTQAPTPKPTPRDSPALSGADPDAVPSPFPQATAPPHPTAAPTATVAPTAQPTATAVVSTATLTPTSAPAPTATASAPPTATSEPTVTPTVDPAATPTVAPTATPTTAATAIPTATATPTPTATATPTPTATSTPTPAATPTPAPPVPPSAPTPFGQLVAQKVTFGPTAALTAEIAGTAPETWIDAQLDHINLDDSVIEGILAGYPTLTNTNAQNWAVLQQDGGQTQVLGEVMHATFLRAVYSPKQVYEMMCDFFFNHLNVSLFGNYSFRHLTSQYLRDVVRPHALGRFSDMLQASAVSPPMLGYLDNWRSNANSSAGVNENYGRELLELHTLGIREGPSLHRGRRSRSVLCDECLVDRHVERPGHLLVPPELPLARSGLDSQR